MGNLTACVHVVVNNKLWGQRWNLFIWVPVQIWTCPMENYLLTGKLLRNLFWCTHGCVGGVSWCPHPILRSSIFNMKWKTSRDQYMDGLICMTTHPAEHCACSVCSSRTSCASPQQCGWFLHCDGHTWGCLRGDILPKMCLGGSPLKEGRVFSGLVPKCTHQTH